MPDTQGYCSCCNFWSRGGRVRPYADDESQERETDSDISSMSSTTFFFKLGKRQSSDVWRQSLSVMDNSGLPSASTYTQYSIPSISAIAKSKTKIVQKVRRRRRKRTVANGTQSVPRTPMKCTGSEMPHGVIQEEDESAVSSMPLQSPSPTQDALSCALSSAQVTDGQSTLSPSLTTSLSPTIRHINVGLVSLNAPQPTRHAPMVVNPPLNPSAESIQTAQTPRGSGTAGPHSPAEILPETGTLSDTRTDSQMKSGTEKSTSGTERVTRPVSALLYDSTRKFSITVRDALSTTRGQVKTITSDLIDVFFRKKFRKGRTLYNPAKTTRMLFLITTISLLSYLPYFLVVLVVSSRGRAYFYGLGELDLVILNFCVRSPYISNVTNPIIYGLLNVHFRNEVLKLLGLKATSEKTPAGSPRHRKSISKPLT